MKPVCLFWVLAVGILQVHAEEKPVSDSLPATFQSDSAKLETIHDLEAGKTPGSPNKTVPTIGAHNDSLENKLRHRHAFIGATLAFAFSDFSGRQLFQAHMDTVATRDSLNKLQSQEPVTVYFPVGLSLAIPVFPYLDLWLRTESFWYNVTGLAHDTNGTQEFGYAVQGNLLGVGARYLVPTSFLSVNRHPGLFVSYTHLWNLGKTRLYNGNGSLYAQMPIAGVGYEVQAGFQQDFEKRWTWTAGLAYTQLNLKSGSSWRSILPEAPDESAIWTLRSLRLCVQGFYQFGVSIPTKRP